MNEEIQQAIESLKNNSAKVVKEAVESEVKKAEIKDTINGLDTSAIIGGIVIGVVLLAFFGKADEATFLFFTNIVAYIMGRNAKT